MSWRNRGTQPRDATVGRNCAPSLPQLRVAVSYFHNSNPICGRPSASADQTLLHLPLGGSDRHVPQQRR
jgi:hypothetical protein